MLPAAPEKVNTCSGYVAVVTPPVKLIVPETAPALATVRTTVEPSTLDTLAPEPIPVPLTRLPTLIVPVTLATEIVNAPEEPVPVPEAIGSPAVAIAQRLPFRRIPVWLV